MWLLYLYMVRQAIIDLYYVITETFEWAFAADERPYLPTMSHLLRTLRGYGIVVLANSAILVIWALYNQIRFRGRERRRAGKPVSVADLAELYGFPAEDIAFWQGSRILIMQHDSDGNLVRVISKDGGQILSTLP